MARDELVRTVAARHGFGVGAVAALEDALERGGGRMAQFSHPELGGMGQWSGGMLQIGAMFDRPLAARVAAAIADLAAAPRSDGAAVADLPGWASAAGIPWPAALGRPSASGAQDGVRYAWFAETRRLVVVRGARVTVYDTGARRISGASQGGPGVGQLRFASDRGAVDLASLRVVGAEVLTKS